MTDFVYTTYIKTTPEKLWSALTNTEFLKQYWGNITSDWKSGSEWKYMRKDDETKVFLLGKVLESVPLKRLVFTWAELEDQKDVSQVTFEIETMDDMLALKVIHDHFLPGSTMASKVSCGWPRVLSSLKTLLETGKPLPAKGACAA